LWTSAGDFLRVAAFRGAVEGVAVTDLARPVLVVQARTLADLPDDSGGAGPDVVVVSGGQVLGYVDDGALATVPHGRRAATPVEAVLVPLPAGASIDAALTGADAVRAVGEVARLSPVMAVRGPDGAVVGLLRYTDVVAALRGAT